MRQDSKKRKLSDASPAEQFVALRKVSELTPATCRKVIGVFSDGHGKRTCSRRQHSHASSFPCLRTLHVPGAEDGTSVKLPCVSVPALMDAKAQACPLYKESMRRACQKQRGELTVLCYADEVTGGNVLSAPQARKANIVHLSWLECPWMHLELQWLTASVCRSSDILRRCDVAWQGWLSMAWGPEDVDLIQIKEIYLLADAKAIRSASGCKGSAGMKPCIHCLNVCALGKAPEEDSHVDTSGTPSYNSGLN